MNNFKIHSDIRTYRYRYSLNVKAIEQIDPILINKIERALGAYNRRRSNIKQYLAREMIQYDNFLQTI